MFKLKGELCRFLPRGLSQWVRQKRTIKNYESIKMKRLLLFVIMGATLLVVFTQQGALGSSPEKSIVGNWEEIGGTQAWMEFLKDGNVIAVAGRQQLAGRYEFLDKNRLRIDYGGRIGAMIFKVSISEDGLVLTEPNGNISEFKRVK